MAQDNLSLGQAAPTLFKTGLGLAQLAQGMGRNPKRPTMTVPSAMEESVTMARGLAQQTTDPILQAQQQQIKANLANTAESAKRVAGSGAQMLGLVAGAQQEANQAQVGAIGQFGQRLQGYQGLLMGALNNLAGMQQQVFNYNQAQLFQEQAQAKSALFEGGAQNIFGGLNDMALMATMNKMFPDGQAGQQPSLFGGLNRFNSKGTYRDMLRSNMAGSGVMTG